MEIAIKFLQEKTAVLGNAPFYIIGAAVIAVTILICGTVLWVTHMKIKSQDQQHGANLKEAEEIREKYYKPCTVQICIKTDTGRKK